MLRKEVKSIITELEIITFTTVHSKFREQDAVLINILILRIVKRRPLKIIVLIIAMERISSLSEMDVTNGMIAMSRKHCLQERQLKAVNISKDQVQIPSFVVCKLIKEMIIVKLSATVIQIMLIKLSRVVLQKMFQV